MPEHVRLLIAWIRLIIARGAFVDDESKKSPMSLVDECSLIEKICTLAFSEPNEYVLNLMRKRNPNFVEEDRGFLLTTVNLCGPVLRYASPYLFRIAIEELRGDRDIVLAAIQQNGDALKYASSELRGYLDIILATYQQNE